MSKREKTNYDRCLIFYSCGGFYVSCNTCIAARQLLALLMLINLRSIPLNLIMHWEGKYIFRF